MHWRFLISSVSDFTRLLSQIYTSLKPGGYIEIKDMEPNVFCDDGTFPPDSASCKWAEYLDVAVHKIGRHIPRCHEYKGMLEAAGFEGIVSHDVKRPTNDWPKDRALKEIGKVSACSVS